MKIAEGVMAFMMLLILAANITDAAPAKMPIQQMELRQLSPQLFGPSININAIYPAGAAPGNSNRVGVNVSVAQLGSPICGLNYSNFKLETLIVPPYGPAVFIRSVGAIAAPIGMPAPPCSYIINVVPATYQGKQYTWLAGTYNVKLDYIKAGKELANKTFSLSIGG